MDDEPGLASSRRITRLAEKFRDKRYRDGYVAAHTRGVLARQMRNFRGDLSQAEFAEQIDKQKTMVARLENPGYAGWSIRTMLEIARKRDVAILARFVDFTAFLQYTGDLTGEALQPKPYDQQDIDRLADQEKRAVVDSALKALFSVEPQQDKGRSAEEAISPSPRQQDGRLPRATYWHNMETVFSRPANDALEESSAEMARSIISAVED
jgi:hypothetical protein